RAAPGGRAGRTGRRWSSVAPFRGGGGFGRGGQGDERVLQGAGGDLQVPGGGGIEQVAGHGVGVGGVHQHALPAHLHLVHPGQVAEAVQVGSGQPAGHGGAHGAPGGEGLDLGGGAVGDDQAAGHQHDPVGVDVRLLQVVGGEQHGAPLVR